MLSSSKNCISVRPWSASDSNAVWNVLTDASYGNVNAAFKISFQKPLLRMITAIMFAVVCGKGYSWFSIILCLLLELVLVYCICFFATVIYLYGSNFSDIPNIDKTYFREKYNHFWVAECNGEIVGTIAIVRKISNLPGSPDINNSEDNFGEISKVALLRRMAVKRTHRGQGIAKLLVNETITFCRSKNYDRIFLITTEIHHAARQLYQQMGFLLTGRKNYRYFRGLVTIETFEYTLKL